MGIWDSDTLVDEVFKNDTKVFESARLGGKYEVTGSAIAEISYLNSNRKMLLTEYVRRMRTGENVFTINTEVIRKSAAITKPSLSERYSRGIEELCRLFPDLGAPCGFGGDDDEDYAAFLGATYSTTDDEVNLFLLEYNANGVFSDFTMMMGGHYDFQISFDAYLKSENPQFSNRDNNRAFVAMWFSSEVQPIWEEALEPTIRACGYQPVRIDQLEHNNKIDDEIIAEIRRSKFVIADFTSERDKPRGGVYYEAGFAQGLGLPVIWTCREDLIDQVHFDTRQFNHIVWKDAEDLSTKLINRIRATIGQGPLSA